jgi:hypothetical protein
VNGQRLLSPDLLAEMHRPQVLAPTVDQGRNAALAADAQGLPRAPSLITDTGYGFYWNTEDFHRLAWHDGASRASPRSPSSFRRRAAAPSS